MWYYYDIVTLGWADRVTANCRRHRRRRRRRPPEGNSVLSGRIVAAGTPRRERAGLRDTQNHAPCEDEAGDAQFADSPRSGPDPPRTCFAALARSCRIGFAVTTCAFFRNFLPSLTTHTRRPGRLRMVRNGVRRWNVRNVIVNRERGFSCKNILLPDVRTTTENRIYSIEIGCTHVYDLENQKPDI